MTSQPAPGKPTVVPYFIAGLPVDAIEALRSRRILDQSSALSELNACIAAAVGSVSDLLHDAIGGLSDRRVRNKALELRRDLYHWKRPTPSGLNAMMGVLPQAVVESVAALDEMLCKRDALSAAFNVAYEQERLECRRRLRQVLADPDFQRGLLLSSPTLFGNLSKYVAAGPRVSRSRNDQIERGLLRYATRAAMKATPFGTLCAVIAGRIVEGGPPRSRMTFIGNPDSHHSVVRLNKRLFRILWDHLKDRMAVRRALGVHVNPTLRIDGDQFVFLAPAPGTEAFRRVPAADTLKLVLAATGNGAANYRELVAEIARLPEVDATEEESECYVDHLLAIGLLRFGSPIRQQDPDWDLALRSFLTTVVDEHAECVATLLGSLRVSVSAYGPAAIDVRVALGHRMRAEVDEALKALGVEAQQNVSLVALEDMTADATLVVSDDRRLRGAMDELSTFADHAMRVSVQRIKQANMRHFFDHRYGAAVHRVSLLEFYETYHREHLKEYSDPTVLARNAAGGEKLNANSPLNPFGLSFIASVLSARNRIGDLFRARWAQSPDAIEVKVALEAIAEAVRGVPASALPCQSASAFCQVLTGTEDSGIRILLPNGLLYAGFGKYFSRFLHLLPTTFAEELLSDNSRLIEDGLLAEIESDADFNGNLHPPLVPAAIGYPAADGDPVRGQISAMDIDVARDAADSWALVLLDRRRGQRVLPLDLGFLSPALRPPLHQLLVQFSPIAPGDVPIPDWAGPTPLASRPGNSSIRYRPRFTVGESIVLSRRRWIVPGAEFPRPKKDERSSDFFHRVSCWRTANGIPEEAYLRVLPGWRPGARAEPDPGEGDDEGFDSAPHPLAHASVTEPPETNEPRRDHRDASRRSREPSEGNNRGVQAGVDQSPEARQAVKPSGARSSRDWRKPQFIDFSSPILVDLFGRLPGGLLAFSVLIDERLPDGAGLPQGNDGRYSFELILQLNQGRLRADSPESTA